MPLSQTAKQAMLVAFGPAAGPEIVALIDGLCPHKTVESEWEGTQRPDRPRPTPSNPTESQPIIDPDKRPKPERKVRKPPVPAPPAVIDTTAPPPPTTLVGLEKPPVPMHEPLPLPEPRPENEPVLAGPGAGDAEDIDAAELDRIADDLEGF